MKSLASLLTVCALIGTLSACGGGGSAAAPDTSAIKSVATPGSISVVTAK